MSEEKTLAILVGGGPAPGINAVIAAATIEARNHGLRVLGCYDGFRWLLQGDTHHVVELAINDVSRIHFEGGSILRTSRTNPTRSSDGIRRVADALAAVSASITSSPSAATTRRSPRRGWPRRCPGLTVAHVPKTIDNDLPLPGDIVTFGFTTACDLGKELVRNLMQDAATTERWFFVTVMGRHAGHLALGIGGAAGATAHGHRRGVRRADRSASTAWPTSWRAPSSSGARTGREHGVALLSEGLAEKLDPATLRHRSSATPTATCAWPSWTSGACSRSG